MKDWAGRFAPPFVLPTGTLGIMTTSMEEKYAKLPMPLDHHLRP